MFEEFYERARTLAVSSVSTLVFGTLGSQVIMIAALPLLTQLFTPEDFSVLAMYIAIVSIASVAACARFDIAISMPKPDGDAANLLSLSLVIALASGALLAIISAVWGSSILVWLGLGEDDALRVLVPLGVWMAASYSAIQLWFLRKKRFTFVAKTRVGQAIFGVFTQLGLGSGGFAPIGLLLGHMLMTAGGVVTYAFKTWQTDRRDAAQVSSREMRQLCTAYQNYPKYKIIDGFATTGSVQLPIFLITVLALGAEGGFLLLAMRAVSAPFQMISGAVSQVYLAEAPEHFRQGNLKRYTRKILTGLACVSVVPLAVIALLAVPAFSWIFGEEWSRSGEIAIWLIPWIFLKFLASPVSWVLDIVNKQRLLMNMKIAMLFFRVSSVLGAHFVLGDYLVEAYAISGALVNFANLAVYVTESEKH